MNPPASHVPERPSGESRASALQSGGIVVLALVALVFFLAYVVGIKIPGFSRAAVVNEEKPANTGPPLGARLVEGQPRTLDIPREACVALGILKGSKERIVVVEVPATPRLLVLTGSTMLDPNRLARIRLRFPAEVVKIGQTVAPHYRELRTGDRVNKGDVLGVFFSVDVGNKKRDLLDGLVQLDLDQQILDKMDAKRGSIPEVLYLTQVRLVHNDRNAVNRALNNLKVWNIPQEDIDALHDEAKKLTSDKDAWFKTPEGRWVKGEKQGITGHDPDREADNPWAKVTLRAPFDGIIVERNVSKGEIVNDSNTNVFQIAQVDRMLVIASAPEDELPTLNALKHDERNWIVRTVGVNPVEGLKGPIEEIGYLIDPNQHTAVIKGYIENPKEEIRAGQTVSATVRIPPPKGVVEVPVDAVVEDGKYAIVFVQAEAGKHRYQMRRVEVTHRLEGKMYVRSTPIPKAEQLTPQEEEEGLPPKEPLRPGERVLLAGAGELKAAVLNLDSEPDKNKR
jgi:cobalt-zinc-cadmium efflux system membrane fusion protein